MSWGTGATSSDEEQYSDDVGDGDANIDDQAGHGEQHQPLVAGFEADGEEGSDEHDETDESQ